MTPQEIFDTVYKHLVTQGKQSRNDTGFCMYRSPEGLKCAVGCLIPDDLYHPEMDVEDSIEVGTYVSNLLKHFPELPDWMREHRILLAELQHVHDTHESWTAEATFSEHGHTKMEYLAKRHKLVCPEI